MQGVNEYMNNLDKSRYEGFKQEYANGSRNPIDIVAHWRWNNPLNLIPISIVLVSLIALALLMSR
jgi:hypothetical protein